MSNLLTKLFCADLVFLTTTNILLLTSSSGIGFPSLSLGVTATIVSF